MTLNRSKTLLAFSASILLVAAYATSSDARPQAQRLNPTQSESVYYHSDSNTMRDSSPAFPRSMHAVHTAVDCGTVAAPLGRGFFTLCEANANQCATCRAHLLWF